MIKIIPNQSLKNFNTFGVNVTAQYFIQLSSKKDIEQFTEQYAQLTKPLYFIGSGANTLFTKNFNGTVVHINTKGIELLKQTEDAVFLKVQAGEIWDDLITYCVTNKYYGIENLVAIPGTVGAAPIQNIGAYGVEAKDSIEEVHYIDLASYEQKTLSNEACQFAYRNSIFKQELKDQFIITQVVFKLSKKANFNLSYGSIEDELRARKIDKPTIKEVSKIIRHIRDSKLPDITKIGNAGSFFKNPIISIDQLHELQLEYPDIPFYPIDEKKVKVAAGWLIDKSGLKSYQIGGAAVHDKQALVLINKDRAKGEDIVELAKHIQQQIRENFGIALHPEVIFV